MHFHTFGVVAEGKADLVDGGRLLFFICIDNEVLVKWTLFEFITITFLKDEEVDVWFHFPYFINLIVDCVYLFIGPHFSEFAFGVCCLGRSMRTQKFIFDYLDGTKTWSGCCRYLKNDNF